MSLLLILLRIVLLLAGVLRPSCGLVLRIISIARGIRRRAIHIVSTWWCVYDHEVILAGIIIDIGGHQIQFQVIIGLLNVIKLLLFDGALILFIMLYVIVIYRLVCVKVINNLYSLPCLSWLGLVSNGRWLILRWVLLLGVVWCISTSWDVGEWLWRWIGGSEYLVICNEKVMEVVLIITLVSKHRLSLLLSHLLDVLHWRTF